MLSFHLHFRFRCHTAAINHEYISYNTHFMAEYSENSNMFKQVGTLFKECLLQMKNLLIGLKEII